MQSLSAERLMEMLAGGEEVHLIDVLPRVSFDRKHIPGAVHASFYDDDFLERVEGLVGDEDATLVVYCASQSCNASARAARALEGAGYAHVVDFEGGMQEWEAAGYPLRGRSAGSRSGHGAPRARGD